FLKKSYLNRVSFDQSALVKRTVFFLFSVCKGNSCSTAGAMDLDRKIWSEELIGAAGVDIKKFPKLFYAHECVGTVTETGATESGYPVGTKVYAGTGDAGATTLASGILAPGEYNINLGTSGWVAAVSNQRMESEGGGFNLAAMQKDLLINVVPFLNGGNAHRLIAKILSRDPDGAPDFGYISELLEKAEPGSHGLFFLPYVAGERFPIMDSSVRGSFLGLSQETTAADMAQSVLEGVAFSIRQGLELFDHPALKITLIGGGARERRWCRILSMLKSAAVPPSKALTAPGMKKRSFRPSRSAVRPSLKPAARALRLPPPLPRSTTSATGCWARASAG
ncbi:MAG: hypothetical protein KHY61_04530, partial [Sutterella wadsworthensis]|nr:hypothetical protein [Sutterella wadsworthensis]